MSVPPVENPSLKQIPTPAPVKTPPKIAAKRGLLVITITGTNLMKNEDAITVSNV